MDNIEDLIIDARNIKNENYDNNIFHSDQSDELDNDEDLKKIEEATEYFDLDEKAELFSPQIEIFEPFAGHVDPSRTNMSAKQFLQLVTSINNDSPYILNKNYRALTDIDSPFVEYAEEDGIVLFSDYDFLVIFYFESRITKIKYCPPTKKLTNNAVILRYKIKMSSDNKFKKGDTLFDYTGQSTESHVPKIGYRAKIMYGSFYGYTADDAFVMSESFAEKTRIDYSKKIFIPITKEIKYLLNENSKYLFTIGDISTQNYLEYFKIDMSDSMLSEFNNTSTKQSKIFGKSVESIDGGTISSLKVHKITDKTFNELNDEYIYTNGLIQELYEQYSRQMQIKETMFAKLSSVFQDEFAKELTDNAIEQWESSNSFPDLLLENISNDYKITKDNIDLVLEIEIYKSEPTSRGDKFANLFAGKGVCSLILPDKLMPNNADIIFNPLGLFGRNNWGTIFEIAIAKIIRDVESFIDNPEELTNRLDFISKNFIEKFDKPYYKLINELVEELRENGSVYEIFKKSVLKDGFYLYVDNFPGIKYKDFLEKFIDLYQIRFDINITRKEACVYSEELMLYMRDRGFTHSVFDKDVVEEVHQNVFFGYNYWIKLFHTANSKYNAIAFASSYSKSTGEAPRGRSNGGGCHTSWQTTAALIGHEEDNAVLKEFRTIKSDAVEDKHNFNKKMIDTGQYALKNKYSSRTIKTLTSGLGMLCLKFAGIDNTHNFEDDVYDIDIKEVKLEDEDEDEEFIDINDLFSDKGEDS